MNLIIKKHINKIRQVCRKLGIKRMHVFGSAVKGHFNKDSDIDLLISFDENLTIEEYTTNYFQLQYQLRQLLNREIDIITESSLSNPYLLESINESKQLIYEA